MPLLNEFSKMLLQRIAAGPGQLDRICHHDATMGTREPNDPGMAANTILFPSHRHRICIDSERKKISTKHGRQFCVSGRIVTCVYRMALMCSAQGCCLAHQWSRPAGGNTRV